MEAMNKLGKIYQLEQISPKVKGDPVFQTLNISKDYNKIDFTYYIDLIGNGNFEDFIFKKLEFKIQ